MDCSHIQYSPGVSSIFLLCDKFGTARSVVKLLSCLTKLQFDFHISGLLLEIQTVATLSCWYTCIVLRVKSVGRLKSHLRKSRCCNSGFFWNRSKCHFSLIILSCLGQMALPVWLCALFIPQLD